MKWCSGGTLATRVLFFRYSQTKKQPPVVFYKKGVLKKFIKFKGLRPATLLKNRLWQTCSSVNFEKFLRQLLLQTLVFFYEFGPAWNRCNSSIQQKQPYRIVLSQRCSEIGQQIYKRIPMPKFDLNKVALQFYWKRTSAWVFSCKFFAYFQSTFS